MDDAAGGSFGPSILRQAQHSGRTDGWIPGERDIGLPGEGGEEKPLALAGGVGGGPEGSRSPHVPLHHASHGPPPPLGEDPRAPRHNQWTREKMVVFLRELAATQSVSAAAKAVGMSRTAPVALRKDRC